MSPNGKAFQSVAHKPSYTMQLLCEVEPVARANVWREASRRWLGYGLAKGTPCLVPAMRARRDLAHEGLWSQVRALDAVVVGGFIYWDDPPDGSPPRVCHVNAIKAGNVLRFEGPQLLHQMGAPLRR